MSETKSVSPVAGMHCFRYSDTASELPGELRYFNSSGGRVGYIVDGRFRCTPIAAYVPGMLTLEVPRAGTLHRYPEGDIPAVAEVSSTLQSQPTNPKQLYGDKKLPLSLVPTSFINATSVALLEGALKYGSNNYRVSPVEAMTYAHACMRHLLKWVHGEDSDPETHVPHLANAAACLAILIDTGVHNTLIDNRPPKQDTSAQVKELEATVAHLRELFKDKAPTHYTQANTKEQ